MKKYILSMLFAMLMVPLSANATDSGVLAGLCELYECVMNNGVVLAVATIAILFLGIGAFFGKVNWGLALMVGLAIIVVAGAPQIAILVLGDNFEAPDECTDGECTGIIIDPS